MALGLTTLRIDDSLELMRIVVKTVECSNTLFRVAKTRREGARLLSRLSS